MKKLYLLLAIVLVIWIAGFILALAFALDAHAQADPIPSPTRRPPHTTPTHAPTETAFVTPTSPPPPIGLPLYIPLILNNYQDQPVSQVMPQDIPFCTAAVTEFQVFSIRVIVSCAGSLPTGWNNNSYAYASVKPVGSVDPPTLIYLGATQTAFNQLIFDGFWIPPTCQNPYNTCSCDLTSYVLLEVILYPDPSCWFCSTAPAAGTPLYWSRGYCLFFPFARR